MKTIKALGKEHIRVLIKDAMKKYGNECDLNHIDVSEMTSLSGVFSPQYENNCSAFNGDISKWDTSKVTDMSYLFYNSKFQGDISQWNTANVKDMSGMFAKSLFNGDISNWDVSNVTQMHGTFEGSPFNGDISRWNVSQVINMGNMFANSQFTGDISNWDVSSLISMKTMFSKSIFNGDISRWDVSKVQYMLGTFEHSQFSGDISKWDISHVRIFHGMFFGSSFNGDISNWKLNPRVQASAVLKNTDNYDAFDSFHDSPLGYLGVLKGKYSFPSDDPRAVAFLEARAVCDTLSLDIIAAAQYLYQRIHELSISEERSVSFEQSMR